MRFKESEFEFMIEEESVDITDPTMTSDSNLIHYMEPNPNDQVYLGFTKRKKIPIAQTHVNGCLTFGLIDIDELDIIDGRYKYKMQVRENNKIYESIPQIKDNGVEPGKDVWYFFWVPKGSIEEGELYVPIDIPKVSNLEIKFTEKE